jgi:hypothetical protein
VRKKTVKDSSASVYQRLLNEARKIQRPFSEILHYFVMERFLYRLSQSPYADKFILKGALLLRAWKAPFTRPTKDIDMMGLTSNDLGHIMNQIKDICRINIENDGVEFDHESIKGEKITEEANYEGARVVFTAKLGNAEIKMQLDIGFGDKVFPAPQKVKLPVQLDFKEPDLFCYTRESVIAEKFEAIIRFGELNSRMKDFYDIWLLARQFNFNGKNLFQAIKSTFDNRGTVLPSIIILFTEGFIKIKNSMWKAFIEKSKIKGVSENFADVVQYISKFLKPVVNSIMSELDFNSIWLAPGPWK